MAECLVSLKESIAQGSETKLIDSDDISTAKALEIANQRYSLDEPTNFIVDEKNQTLRSVYHCFLHQNSNTTDYISDCEAKNLPVIAFLPRTDLIGWLKGASDTSKFIKKDKAAKGEGVERKRKAQDPFLEGILKNERDLIDHNKALRGSKQIDFSSVARECESKIIKALKYNNGSSKPTKTTSTAQGAKPPKHKEPIIILSPSASSLITMSNVKEFLENGHFIDPTTLDSPASNLQMVQRNKVQKVNNKRPVKFLVVDNVEKFFVKPEHWDRVIAVFTTGQPWQFKNYQVSNPPLLFQKVKGFFWCYSGDYVPPTIRKWGNVEIVEIDRNRRFKDRQIVEAFWDSLDKAMARKGY